MVLDDELRELIMQNASTNVLRNEAKKRGMRTLRESGPAGDVRRPDDHRRGGPRDDHRGISECRRRRDAGEQA
jgi:hypothetical protein